VKQKFFSVDESWLSRQPPAAEPRNSLELAENLAAQEKEMTCLVYSSQVLPMGSAEWPHNS
jgi:hypothetical protein